MAARPDDPRFVREKFHPLEIIPFFRRWRPGLVRDVLYTFVWSSLFGVGFFAISVITSPQLPGWRAAGQMLLISNVIGYVIHALFSIGQRAGCERWAKQSGYAPKVAYYTFMPMLGVVIGFEIVSLLLDQRLFAFVARPAVMVSIALTSLVISLVLSTIFFWRERSAKAEAEVALERARVERIEREAASAHLRALQAQIEPHFLFNTLANVTSLVDPDPAKAKRMLESFIRFLRASLAATRAETTTLGDEADLIASYLDVLQVRMGERLAYAIDVPPELRGVALAPMLVQPLVENAIRHGLEPKVEGGRVTVAARREGERVRIEVSDSGVGFGATTRGGVGLTNIRERLRLLHDTTLQIGDAPGGGARVSFTIPA